MVQPDPPLLTGTLLDEECELTLRELASACGVSAECLIEMVEEGMLEPSGNDPLGWRFPPTALKRARTALHLQEDLGINLAGAALVVDLLDEIRQLRGELARLRRCLLED